MEYIVFTDESQIVASRFQGLSAFSLHKSAWKDTQECMRRIPSSSKVSEFKWQKAPSLFEHETISFSKGEKFRFRLLDRFNRTCKAGKYGVALDSKQGLFTDDAKRPINFWYYVP